MRSTILCRETKEIKEFAAAGSRSFLPSIRRIPCLKIPAGAVRKSRDETTSSTLLPRRRHRWLTTMSLAACRLTLNGDGAAERRYELAPLPGSAGNWTTVVRGRNFLIARRWSPSCVVCVNWEFNYCINCDYDMTCRMRHCAPDWVIHSLRTHPLIRIRIIISIWHSEHVGSTSSSSHFLASLKHTRASIVEADE